jgi:diadenosine tetraphosphatase ApaH/serine/threonine PP2A family protein phosphatase
MRYAVFADIHSNLEAWGTVLEALKKENVDKFVCVGDIVGYGADPRECIDLLGPLDVITVAGNHDWASIGKLDITYFNIYARQAVLWTMKNLRITDKDYLGSLELVQSEDNFTLVHGSLDRPEEFRYILHIESAKPSFRLLEKTVLFIAHSHVPFVLSIKGEKEKYLAPGLLNLLKEERYIINVGSVGQPRDGDPRACYVIYDTERDIVEFKRIEYDIITAQRKIVEAGLPGVLAERLAVGA